MELRSGARASRLALLVCLVAAGTAATIGGAACGENEGLVRPRLDTSTDGATEGGNLDGGTLGCGEAIPTTYTSAAFATNAAVELGLIQRFAALSAKMIETEGAAGSTTVTATDLKNLFGEGAPSLRAVSAPVAQTTVDGYFDAFGAAIGKSWQPSDAEQDGGATAGGKYDATFTFSEVGVDLRAAAETTLLSGALYNHVLGLVAAPITDATIDRLVAAWGATPSLANRTDADAGTDEDKLVAALSSKRDDKSQTTPGAYRKMRTALLTMKAAVVDSTKCKTDLDAAVSTFLLEWERTIYASAIFELNAASVAAAELRGPAALHSYGRALGLIQSFKGIPADKRKISDAQVDALLTKMGATTPYKLVTNAGDRVLKLGETINDVALYEGFQSTDVEAFRKAF